MTSEAEGDSPEKRAQISPNTRRAYEAALRGFEGSGRPETDAGVAAYLGELYDHGRSAAVAAMVVAALRFRAKLHGRPSPVGAAAERALAGFRRIASERGYGKVAGISWEQADRVAAMAEHSGGLPGLRDAAIIAVASDALLRVSEISALYVDDVGLEEQTVLIWSSKTDQEGAVQFLGEPTVARVRAWLLGSGLTQGPLFRAVLKGNPVADGTPDGEEHPPHHHPPRPGRRGGWPHQRTQPARGQRAEPGERRRHPGRDTGSRTLVLTRHAGALRAGGAGGTGSRGEAPLRLVTKRRNGGFVGRFVHPIAYRQLPAGMRGSFNETACSLITGCGRRILSEIGNNELLQMKSTR